MGAFNSVVLFVIVWWVVLFAVLPWGIQSLDAAANPARWQGAPERPMMWRKLAATTAISLVVWGVATMAIRGGWIPLRPIASVTGE